MNFDPQRFFIGLMGFFSILLPGVLLTFIIMNDFIPVVLEDRFAALAVGEEWAGRLSARRHHA
ncbi:hypothetical protein [Arthrobacter sp. B0490]|uniref:hypothetical protein n=1 Tax=Arthrobacter sp. B0490 TaxID=2058891 RepID=UPI0011B0273F|nr:hypothetical protein [Arthrobacter sp. B0490]